jgi:putative SOS response-associated peptidase YedK
VGHLHDRMPMSVPVGNWSAWLDPGFGPDARGLLTVEVSGLTFHPVSTAVNKVANDGPELVEPIAV